MRGLTLIIFLCFTASFSLGQTGKISGIVKDSGGRPIPKVKYYLTSSPNNFSRTEDDGAYNISFEIGDYDTLKFEIVHFKKQSIFIGPSLHRKAKKREILKDITLLDRVLGVVYITPDQPDTLFGTQEYSVEDFEYLPSGDLLLLTYEKRMDKGSALRLLNSEMEVVDTYYLGTEITGLEKDYLNRIHVIGKENVSLVRQDGETIRTLFEDPEAYYRRLAPIIDTIGERIYFSNYSEVYPAFEYQEFNRRDSLYKILLKVEDKITMLEYRGEFKFTDIRTQLWAHRKEIETGIDKEIWVGASIYTNTIYYEPLYAPLFKIDSHHLLIFDHYKNSMFTYHHEKGIIDSTSINYHLNDRKSGWEQPLIQDELNQKIYALFLRGGYSYLSEISPKDGKIKNAFKLNYKYIEQVRIYDGKVHYIYRPFESPQKKYLYTEELKI